MEAITIGLDLAKSVFQVHGVDAGGRVVLQRRLKRREVASFFARLPPALVGMEACGSAHHWARVLRGLGHEVRLMPPAYVKPYVRRNKTDARDAEAICEAVRRPSMRFVPMKTPAEQAARGLHRARELLVRQRIQVGNLLRGLSAEFGLVAPEGRAGLGRLVEALGAEGSPVPEPLREVLVGLARQWQGLDAAARELEGRIAREAKGSETARRLMTVPGIGPVTAHAILCAVPDPGVFRSARDFAAWVGLTPRQSSSGTKARTGPITKAGDRSLRRLLVLGASALGCQARIRPAAASPWLMGLLGRRPVKVAVVAQAAKTARIVFALLASGESYRAPRAIPA